LPKKWTSTNPYLTQTYHNLQASVHLAQEFIFLYKYLLFTGKVRHAHPPSAINAANPQYQE
jgi:hypothetical protein